MSTKHVHILKLLTGTALIIGAVAIMLPGFVSLFTSLGRITLLIVLVVGIAFLSAQFTYHLRTRKSAKQENALETSKHVNE